MGDQSSYLSTFRTGRHTYEGVRLSICKGTVVASGSITATPSSPTTSIAVSYSVGSEANAYRGMRVNIKTSGGLLKGTTHVRFSGTISSAALPIREMANAKISIVSGDTFELVDEPMLVAKLPTADETFSPDGLAYTDEGDDPPPIALSGGHVAKEVPRGATVMTVQMQGGGELVDPDSVSAVTHLWTLPTGVAFASGSADTDSAPTLEADPGIYVVKHTVTDPDNSKTTTQRVFVIADDQTGTYSYEVTSAQVEGAEQGLGAAYSSATVDLPVPLSLDDAPDGSLAILWLKNETIGGSTAFYRADYTSRAHILFVGYIRRGTATNDIDAGDVISLELISPLARLAEMVSYSKVLDEEATPDAWSELTDLRVGRAMTQIIQFYTSLIESGFDWTQINSSFDKDYPKLYLNESTFHGQTVELASGVSHRIVCERNGRFLTQFHPALVPLASRATTQTTSTYTSADVYPGYTFSRQTWEPVKQCIYRGFTKGDNPQGVATVYPSNSPGMGTDTPSYERGICDDVADAKALVGMYGAFHDEACVESNGSRRHALTLDATFSGGYDHFDFTLTEYQQFDLDNAWEIDTSASLFYLRRYRTTYGADGMAEVSAQFSEATYAPAGEVLSTTTGVVVIEEPPVVQPPVTGTPVTPDGLYPGIPNLAIFVDDNTMRLTTNYNRSSAQGGPNWSSVSLPGISGWPGGTVIDFVVDPYSPKYLGTGTAVNGWLVTTTHVMNLNAIGNSMTISNATSLGSTTLSRCIDSSRGTQNFVMIISYDTTNGTKCHYTTNGGTSWSSSTVSATIDANYLNNGNSWSGGLLLSMHNSNIAYATAFNTTTDADGYVTTNGGSSWTQISGGSPNFDPGQYPGNAIVTPVLDATITRVLYGYRTKGAHPLIIPSLYRTVGSTSADISPSFSAKAYGPVWSAFGPGFNRRVTIADDDPETCVLCGHYTDGTNISAHRYGVFVTRNVWSATAPTWTSILDDQTSMAWAGVYGVSANLFYLFGQDGRTGTLSYSGGSWTLDSRVGDLSTTGDVVGLCGL